MHLTQEQIIAELETAIGNTEDPPDAYTTLELGDLLGLSNNAVRVRLRILSEAGRIEVVRVTKPNIAGVPQPRMAYRILPAKEEEE
jgi:predicted ArsR family transcriptional regulator